MSFDLSADCCTSQRAFSGAAVAACVSYATHANHVQDANRRRERSLQRLLKATRCVGVTTIFFCKLLCNYRNWMHPLPAANKQSCFLGTLVLSICSDVERRCRNLLCSLRPAQLQCPLYVRSAPVVHKQHWVIGIRCGLHGGACNSYINGVNVDTRAKGGSASTR